MQNCVLWIQFRKILKNEGEMKILSDKLREFTGSRPVLKELL